MADLFKAISDQSRREILELLKNGRMSAGDIYSHFDMTSATVSHHLSLLKESDLVRTEKVGKFILYELNCSVLDELLLWILSLKEDK
ncbi:autorepressor SdpR family transcription factor [Paenibacillus terrae]